MIELESHDQLEIEVFWVWMNTIVHYASDLESGWFKSLKYSFVQVNTRLDP